MKSKHTTAYRLRRWFFIHVGWFGINDPDDVGPYFAARLRLIAERDAERS